MEWESFTTDQIESQLAADELMVYRLRARQLAALEELDRRQVATGDGSRNLSEWLAARCDLSTGTSRSLVQTMRRTTGLPHLRQALASGGISFDRAEALSTIREDVGTLAQLDVSGVRRAAADMVAVTSDDELEATRERFLVMQPALDESWWKCWGGLDGLTGMVIDEVLTEKADLLPDLPDGETMSLGWRKATALYQLVSGDNPPSAQVTVFVDATNAVASNAGTGVRLEAGPRVGAQALAAVFCDAVTEVTVNTADGVALAYGRAVGNIPPRLRRAVLARTGGFCAADECNSRYRVQVHHKNPGAKEEPPTPTTWWLSAGFITM